LLVNALVQVNATQFSIYLPANNTMGFQNSTSRTRTFIPIIGGLEVSGEVSANLFMTANAQLGPIAIRCVCFVQWALRKIVDYPLEMTT
jgi:hypothetical protein